MPGTAFQRLGFWVAHRPRTVVVVWVLAVALGAWGAHRLPQAALGGLNGIPGSASKAARDALRNDFDNPFLDPLVVAVSAPQLSVDGDPYLGWLRRTQLRLAGMPDVRRVRSFADARAPQLRSADGHTSMLIVGLASHEIVAREGAVTSVRQALAPLRAELQRLDPAARVAVTGGPAVAVDINTWSAAGGDRAEKRALPLTLAILVVAFGTVVAAGLPFLMGLTTTTVALGMAYVLALLVPVSNLLSNVVTMIGLAIGIDYSLLMVTHYREHAHESDIGHRRCRTPSRDRGRTVAWSGLTVMIGLLGLLCEPDSRDPLRRYRRRAGRMRVGAGGADLAAGRAGAARAAISIASRSSSNALQPAQHRRLWYRLGARIVRHPLPVLMPRQSSRCWCWRCRCCMPTAASPTSRGSWRAAWSPASAWTCWPAVRSDNASLSVYAIVHATDGLPALAPKHLPALIDYAKRLRTDPRIAEVASPVTLQPGMGLAEYAALLFGPRCRRCAISRPSPNPT